MTSKKFSIFFPMYNERENIEKVLAHALEVIPTLGFENYEILIIDDGSRDGCDKIVEAWASRNSHIRLYRHARNMGYGGALRTGFLEASGDVVFYTDSDLPIDLSEIGEAIPLLAEADLVIGYRIKRFETFRRAIYSRIYNRLMRLLFGVRVRDVNFSFKLIKGNVLEHIRGHLTATSVFIDGQLLAEARRYNYKIAEIPIEYTPRRFGSSSFDSLYAARITLQEMLIYWWQRLLSREKEPVIGEMEAN